MPRICFFSASSRRPRKPSEFSGKTEIQSALRIGMFVQTAKQIVLPLLIESPLHCPSRKSTCP